MAVSKTPITDNVRADVLGRFNSTKSGYEPMQAIQDAILDVIEGLRQLELNSRANAETDPIPGQIADDFAATREAWLRELERMAEESD